MSNAATFRSTLHTLAEMAEPRTSTCILCGKRITPSRIEGRRAATDAGSMLCRSCWRKSPAGKALERERFRQMRAAKKQQQQETSP